MICVTVFYEGQGFWTAHGYLRDGEGKILVAAGGESIPGALRNFARKAESEHGLLWETEEAEKFDRLTGQDSTPK